MEKTAPATNAATPRRRRGSPVRKFDEAERAAWSAANPDLLSAAPRKSLVRPLTELDMSFRAAVQEVIAKSEPDLFVTLAFNRETSPLGAQAKLREFEALVDHAALGRNWLARPERRCIYVAVIENSETNLHLHVALKTENPHKVAAAIPAIWKKLIEGGSTDVQAVYNESGLGRYLAKQLRNGDTHKLLFESRKRSAKD